MLYSLERLIESLENDLVELKSAKDNIELSLDEASEVIADTVREMIAQQASTLIEEEISYNMETQIDMSDLENEILEELSDKVRMEF